MNNTTARDLFDELADDPFDNVSSTEDDALEKIKNDLSSLIEKIDTKDRRKQNGALVNEVKNFVRAELSKVKPTQNVIERQIEQVIKHEQVVRHVQVPMEPKVITAPPQIIREVRVEVPAKETRKLVDQDALDKALKRIDDLEIELRETRRRADSPIVVHGGSGVIGIPPPEAAPDTYVLTNDKGKAKWKASQGGTGGGITPVDTYNISNVTTTQSLDATNTSLDELASAFGSLVASLRAVNIIL